MIKILINGLPIELRPDTKITLHFQSPIFFEEGTYSLPIRIANSKTNKRIFNFPARVGNLSNKQRSYPCELVANSFRLKGLLVINSVSQDEISAYYTDGIGQFNYLAEGKFLTDIEDPEPVTLSSVNDYFAYLFDTINYQYPERKFVAFPSINLALFDKTNAETITRNREGWMNEWDWNNNQFKFFVNEYNVPHFFLNYVLEKLFATYGFNLDDNLFYNHIELRQLVVMTDFFKKVLKGLFYSPTNTTNDFHPAYYLPKYLVKSFINDLRNMFFCEFFINNRSQNVDIKFLRDILISPQYNDITDKADKNYSIEPDEIEDGYNFGYELDQDDDLLTEILDISKFNRGDDVETHNDLPDYGEQVQQHENEIRLVRNENAFYFLFYDYNNTNVWQWTFFSDNLASTITGSGELSRISSTIPPRMKQKSSMRMPHVNYQAFDIEDHPFKEQGGVFTQFKEKDIAQNKPRLVFWHGKYTYFQPNHYYPFASHDIYYQDIYSQFHKIPGKTVALLMTGEGNLYDHFGTEFVNWWFNVKKYTTWRINWETIDLHTLDFSAKYRVGNQNYLVKSVEATIQSNGNLEIGDTELVLT